MRKLIIFFAAFFLCSCNSTKKQEPVETEPVHQEEPAKDEPVNTVEDDEYSRSTFNVNISKEDFLSDKNEILAIIAKLSDVMANYDFEAWIPYIDRQSVEYWSNPMNLKNASKRLPIKNQRLNNLNDYFRMVFVPSRKNRSVEEIRYVSRDSVKAVEVRDDTDIVYYNFVKINGKWMVKIPYL